MHDCRPESSRETRNKELVKLIAAIHGESRGTYGWPRVHAELVLGLGESVNRKRVARLMWQAGLQGIHRRRGRKNLVNAATEEDLVHRQFTVAGLDRLWLTDITEHPTAEGKLYCAAVMDACSDPAFRSRYPVHILGFLEKAPRRRAARLDGNRRRLLRQFDDGIVLGHHELELLDRKAWKSRKELANAIFEWIECWYNPKRRHSSLGMLSPADYETRLRPPDHGA